MSAKQIQQKKISQSGKSSITLEENTAYDDNFLPPAEELAKLKDVQSDIVSWIMRRTEIEQEARIKDNHDRIRLYEKSLNHTHHYNYAAFLVSFIITVSFMGFSFYLILEDKAVLGTIFAGGTIVLIISYFLKAKK